MCACVLWIEEERTLDHTGWRNKRSDNERLRTTKRDKENEPTYKFTNTRLSCISFQFSFVYCESRSYGNHAYTRNELHAQSIGRGLVCVFRVGERNWPSFVPSYFTVNGIVCVAEDARNNHIIQQSMVNEWNRMRKRDDVRLNYAHMEKAIHWLFHSNVYTIPPFNVLFMPLNKRNTFGFVLLCYVLHRYKCVVNNKIHVNRMRGTGTKLSMPPYNRKSTNIVDSIEKLLVLALLFSTFLLYIHRGE